MPQYYVYILASRSRTLYIGMTNDLTRRLYEHRTRHSLGAFSARYDVHRLVYYEVAASPYAAIAREKDLKVWSRERKLQLIESMNPGWGDLAIALGLVEEEG
jgi:putative endonuclease